MIKPGALAPTNSHIAAGLGPGTTLSGVAVDPAFFVAMHASALLGAAVVAIRHRRYLTRRERLWLLREALRAAVDLLAVLLELLG